MKKLIVILLLLAAFQVIAQQQKTKNLIIVTLDGFRWQELFKGADSTKLFSKNVLGQDSVWKIQKYWGKDVQERREKLMPFFWNTIAKHGQVYGNRDLGNYVNVKNKYWNSHPGYSEMFTGYPDSLVVNGGPPNPNINVLEVINQQPGYKDKVAVFASWDEYYRILNEERSGLLINAGWADLEGTDLNEVQKALNAQQHYLPKIFGTTERLDAATYAMAKEYLKQNHPKVFYVAFIDTDAFGHRGQYDYYLDAAHYIDAMISDLWKQVQSDPFYKDQTTLFITTDHGRGQDKNWTNHHYTVPNSDEIWFAAMGPDTKPLGEIKNREQLYQNQFAKTLAAFLGLNFTSANPIGEKVHNVLTSR